MSEEEIKMNWPSRPGVCNACGAKLRWIKTFEKGRWMPCELELLAWNPEMGKATLVTPNGVIVTRPHDGIMGYKPHWAACPKANEFRKKRMMEKKQKKNFEQTILSQ